MDHIEDYITKGNLSDELKLSIAYSLNDMMKNGTADEKEFAITTLITQRKVLSYWPESFTEE